MSSVSRFSGVHLSRDTSLASVRGSSLQASMRIRPTLPKLTSIPYRPKLEHASSVEPDEPGSTPRAMRKRERGAEESPSELAALRSHIERLEAKLAALPPVGARMTVCAHMVPDSVLASGVWIPTSGRHACERWYEAGDLPELLPLTEGTTSLRASHEGKELFRLANHVVDSPETTFIRVGQPPKRTLRLNELGCFEEI